jgi:hypothetical protein
MSIAVLLSCEQENYQPNLTAAPGGGTVTTYKAYTLSSTSGANIYGRVVFYKYNTKTTLVQIGLYNTNDASTYSAAIFGGKVSDQPSSALVTLYNVDGATGGFAGSKFFVINSDGFYDKLDAYNANVKVTFSSSTVSQGDIGKNAEPVAEN